MSSCGRLGECSLVEGVGDASERPEDPALEGLPPSIESLLAAPFLRGGTPSGHVH